MPIQSAARRTTGAMLVACAALFATDAGAQVTIDPDGGQLTVNSGQSSYTATFTITNSGGSTDWVDTYCTESGVVSNCQLAGDPLVMVPAYGSAQVDVNFSASQGTGTLTLEGLGFGGYDNGSYNVTVQGAAYALSITPDALTLEQPANTASSQAFTVQNLSGSQATISFATICSGALEACITPPSVTLASSATTTVNVNYGSATGGVLHLVGTVTASPTVKDSGRITVTVPASGSSYPVAVTPVAGVLGDRFNDSSYTVAFTVKNNTAGTDTYDLECVPTSGTVCVSQTLSVATLMSGGSANLSVTFRINTGTTGSGSVRLVAEGQSGFGQGQYAFTAWPKVPYAVVVTPSSGSGPSRHSFTSGHTADFTIKNVGTQQGSYTLTCEPAPTITCTGQSLPSVVLNAFQFATNTVTYSAGASGSRYIDSRATSASGSAVGKWNFTVTQNPSYRVAVSPDNWPIGLASGAAASVPFTIRNPGTVANTYAIAASCLWNGSSVGCTRSPASLTVQPGATGTVTVSLTAGASGTGRILVTGSQSTDAAVKDTGWVNLSLGTAQAPAVNVAEVNQGTSVERDQCLTIALADGAASECGDLRLAQPLPTIKTLNSVRAPTLVYSSSVAHPYPLVAARVSLPAGARNPDYVEAVLRVNGVIKRTAQWRGADFGVARASHIVLGYDAFAESAASGIHPYTVEVTNVYGAVRLTTTAAGQMLIVNRAASAFGAGWWLAGLEQLLLPGSATMVWVGGDGSARTYQQVTSGVWAAAALDHPDTVKLVASEYVRYLPGQVKIYFNTLGRHVRTTNRLGHVTQFGYDGSGRLSTITVPPSTAGLSYVFAYPSGMLATVTAPGRSGATRVTTITTSGLTITSIRDPDTSTVALTYEPGVANRVKTRTDRRSTVSTFTFDAGHKIKQSLVDLDPGEADIVTTVRPVESLGLFAASGQAVAIDTAEMYAMLDGPRSDVGDSTRYWLTRLGAARRIINAVGNETELWRQNATYPGVVTKVRFPNGTPGGRVMVATYDGRGHLYEVTDSSTVIGGIAAKTRYEWNQQWDAIERAVLPEGDSTMVGIDAATGHRIWQQDGRGAMSRITFNYYTSGTASGLVRSVYDPGAAVGDSIIYDAAWGNVSAVKAPSGIWSYSELDRYGRDSLSLAPIDTPQTKDVTKRVLYDLSDRATQVLSAAPAMPYTLRRTTSDTSAVPAETLWVNNEFDKEGNLTKVTSYGNNDAGVDQITEIRTYDRANRLKSVAKGSGPASFTYDAAGNAIRMQYRSGKEVIEEFDALNRRVRRIVPQMDYAQSFCTQHQLGLLTDGGQCFLEFPLYPNNGTAYRVAADTLTFVYDATGYMIRADNRDARITRSYFPNGLLETDSIALRDVIGYQTGFSTKYGIRYRYDRNGRRTSLHSALSDSIGYTYSTFGALDALRTHQGNRFRFTYDGAGRVDTLVALSSTDVEGMREWRQYDVDGQLRVRERRSPSLGILTRDQLSYDARGKILEAHTFSAATDHIQKRTTMAYSGLGPILASEVTDETLYARWELEEFRPDRFGNNYYRKRTTGATGVEEPRVSTFALHSGALTATSAIFGPYETEWSDEVAQQLDLAGNVLRAGQVKEERVSPIAFRRSQSASVSYYSGDNRLMAMQRYDASLLQDGQYNPITGRGTWEEYRYDALGRRVVTIVRRGLLALCSPQISPDCDSYVERVVWDGDDLLYEHREGGSQYTSGSVGYVQGGVIDQPLAQLNGRILNPNWRGLYESSVLPNGTRADCSLPGSGTCITVAWPAGRGVYYIRFPVSGGGNPSTWIGSLASNGEGSTGLLYRRNRFYDPATGQFTQQDPIGLAGGLNQYGFANGDPVNFSDPFGLCPMCVAVAIGLFELGSTAFDAWQASKILNDEGASGGEKAFAVAGVAAGIVIPGPGSAYLSGGRRLASGLVRDFTTSRTKNLSAEFGSERAARTLARERLGRNPVEVEPGKWRSANGKWQYRAKPNDLSDNHIHIEELNPRTGEVLQNIHLRWKR